MEGNIDRVHCLFGILTPAKSVGAASSNSTTSSQTNPLGTPDPTAEFPQEIYKIDRKATETREVVEFELAAPTDLAGVRIPKRQCTRSVFPSIGTFVQ